MAETPLELNDTITALRFISQTHRSLHDQRRKSETQAFFTALTLYALIGAARFTTFGVIPDPFPCILQWAVWILVSLIAAVSALYLGAIHNANQVNKKIAHNAENEIRRILRENGATLDDPPTRGKVYQYAPCACQILIIFVFAVAAGFLLIFGDP